MSLTIDMSPSMEKEALGFATMRGKSLEQLFLDYLQTEMRKSRETERQRDVILRIAGTWVDDRSDEEIIADIENSRTPTRTFSVRSEISRRSLPQEANLSAMPTP